MKNNKIISLILPILGITSFCFITLAPTYNGTVLSKVTTVFNGTSTIGTNIITSQAIPTDDSQYFGVQYSQTGITPNVTVTYDQSFNGTSWIVPSGTIATALIANPGTSNMSLQLPVAPLIRFVITGQPANGTSTLTLLFMRQ